MDLKESGQHDNLWELDHWWVRTRYNYLECLVESMLINKVDEMKVLELGSGTAPSLKLLRNKFSSKLKMTGIDIGYVGDSTIDGIEYKNSVEKIPSQSCDLLVLMDVLEHVSDDSKMLNLWLDKIRPGGYIFITVPAHKFLWSSHDTYLEHYRRYNLFDVRGLLEGSNLRIIKLSHFFAFLVPVVYFLRVLINGRRENVGLKKSSKLVNWLFAWVGYFEYLILKNFRSPLGTSIVAIARKVP